MSSELIKFGMGPAVASLGKSLVLWAAGEEAAVIRKTYLKYSECESSFRTLIILKKKLNRSNQKKTDLNRKKKGGTFL